MQNRGENHAAANATNLLSTVPIIHSVAIKFPNQQRTATSTTSAVTIMLAQNNTFNPTMIPPKPSRPFTEYHIFFQLERNYILQTSDKSSHIDTTIDFADIDPDASTRPPRYRSLTLPKHWYTKGSRPKRRGHRKAHGKISFVELTKLISQRWREADQVTREYCRELSQRGLKRYKEDMKEYVERYGEDAIQTIKAEKKKEKLVKEMGEKMKQDTKQGKLVRDVATVAATQALVNNDTLIRRKSRDKYLSQSFGVSDNNEKTVHTTTPMFLPVVGGGSMMYLQWMHMQRLHLQWLAHERHNAIRPTNQGVECAASRINEFRREIEDSASAIMASTSSSVSLGKSTEKDEIVITGEDDESDVAPGKAASDYVPSLGPVFVQREDKPPEQDCHRLLRLAEVAHLHNYFEE